MDEQMIARALKVQALKEMLGFYLLSLETGEEVDRTTLLKFARRFDNEEGTSLSPLLRIFKPADVETLIRLYREDATLEALQSPASTPVTAPVQPMAPGAKILRIHPTSAAPRASAAAPVVPAIPDWLRQTMKSEEEGADPPDELIARRQPQDALLRVTRSAALPASEAEHDGTNGVEPLPIVDDSTSAGSGRITGVGVLRRNSQASRTNAAQSRRLPAFNRKTMILIGVMIIGLIAVFAAIGLVISNQAKPSTTPSGSGQNATPPAGPVNPLTAPTTGPAPTNQPVAPAATPGGTSGYDWSIKFGIMNREVEKWRDRCNLSPDQANAKLTEYSQSKRPAAVAAQIAGPCQ